MNLRQIKDQAWECYKNNCGISIVVFLIAQLIMGVGTAASQTILGVVLTVFANAWMIYGMTAYSIGLIRGRKAEINTLFDGVVKDYRFNVLGLYLLRGVFVFLWLLLLIIPGIIKSYAYSMAMFIYHDNPDMSITDALKKSEEMMYGHKFEFFVLQLSFFWWWVGCIFTFGLLYIFFAPYYQIAVANYYEKLSKNSNNEYYQNSQYNQ